MEASEATRFFAESIQGNGVHATREIEDEALKRFRGKFGGEFYSDVSNGRLFISEYGQDLRYVHAWEQWHYYEDGIWKADTSEYVVALAKVLSDNIGLAARRWLGEETARYEAAKEESGGSVSAEIREALEVAKGFFRHASRLPNGKIHAMLANAQSEEGIPLGIAEMNQYPMLLPCRNGVVDLTTGELLPHNRDYLFTQGLDIDFDSSATCPRWEQFMLEVMGHSIGPDLPDDSETTIQARLNANARAHVLSGYLQRYLGYCLTAHVKEQIIPIFFGNGSNGKSVLVIIMLQIMGTLGKKATRELLAVKRQETHPTEVCDLFAKRFVASTELEQGQELASALTKDVTGGEKLTARRMFEDFWSFEPSHKIVLSTNYKPRVKDSSHAMWRRIQCVPFTVTFIDPDSDDCTDEQRNDPRVPKQDKNLVETLQDELPGILAWLVRGCLEWQQIGIRPPEEVVIATNDYRAQQNVLRQFIASECEEGPGLSTPAKALFNAFKRWAEENNERRLSQRDFVAQLETSGFAKVRDKKGFRWLSIRLNSSDEEDSDWELV